jgi:DNA modification methylase
METWPLSRLKPFQGSLKTVDASWIQSLANRIQKFGFSAPFLVWKGHDAILDGHQRYQALKLLNWQDPVPVVLIEAKDEKEAKQRVLEYNSIYSKIDKDIFEDWSEDLDLDDLNLIGMESLDASPTVLPEGIDDVPALPKTPKTKLGDLYQLGNHRLLCGDSTKRGDVERLMEGKKADMVFTDPPYGMKKEKEGVLNDNLNYADLLDFNRLWIPHSFSVLEDNGSWYCWGTDEPLMDIYSEIIKLMIKTQKATFRNLLTWDKGSGQGQNSENTRSYAIADEKCLFVMAGVQGFNNNADNYFEGWEPIRDYLLQSRLAMGWDVPTMKKIVGHSDLSRDHWTSKSQFNFPTRDVYEKLKAEADRVRHETKNDAFKREYDDLKREYYSTRAYFNNTHANFNNVWHFPRHNKQGDEGDHATIKPIALCELAIKSSSRESDIVLDLFGGSGSTLIACEQTNRICHMMELSEGYMDVIISRWEQLTGKTATLLT